MLWRPPQRGNRHDTARGEKLKQNGGSQRDFTNQTEPFIVERDFVLQEKRALVLRSSSTVTLYECETRTVSEIKIGSL